MPLGNVCGLFALIHHEAPPADTRGVIQSDAKAADRAPAATGDRGRGPFC